jgi:hypothetical protein
LRQAWRDDCANSTGPPDYRAAPNDDVVAPHSVGPIGGAAHYSLRHDDRSFVVFSFAKLEDAQAFANRSSGDRLATGRRR